MHSSPDHAPRTAYDDAAIARLLANAGIGERERETLPAFALHATRYDLALGFAEAFSARTAVDVSEWSLAAEAELCETLLEIVDWDFSPAWLDRLLARWLDCYRSGASRDFPWRACGALLAGCRRALIHDRREVSPVEMDILAGLERIVGCVAAALADAAIAFERAARAAAEETDAATGLPNRVRFARLIEAPPVDEGMGRGLVILSVEWGEAARALPVAERNALRHALSERMRQSVRAGDTLCALGEDEWALVLTRLRSPAQVPLAANRLVESCSLMLEGEMRRYRGKLTAGGALTPHTGPAVSLEAAARTALVAARAGGLPFDVYRPEIAGVVETDVDLEREFLAALQSQRLQVFLQPQVSLAGRGECTGAEALLRWQRESGEWVAPNDVIELAERLDVMAELRQWLVSRVARIIGDLARSRTPARISLNVTAGDMRDEEFPEVVSQALSLWRADPRLLVIELTENALVADDGRACDVLSRLRALGCEIALDDFGTGFSSLAYLRRLPVNEIKIDQVFVRAMLDNEKDWAIVESVLALAKGFGLSVVAEGVEDEPTRDALAALGCNRIQGFLVARAMPVSRFVEWRLHHDARAAGAGGAGAPAYSA